MGTRLSFCSRCLVLNQYRGSRVKHFFFGNYFILLVVFCLTIFGVGIFSEYYLNEKHQQTILELNQELSKGTFYLIEKELETVSEEQFKSKLENLQPKFGYPLSIDTIEKLSLEAEEQRKLLISNKIVVQHDGALHSKRIGQTHYVLTMGPFDDLRIKPLEVTVFIAFGALIFGILLLFWAIFFWKKLRKISDATASFGKGDFSARASVSRFSSLSSIANTFNSMADQIEQLISSHKQLVNSVSHELRTPISRIKFGMESLRTADDMERSKQLSGMRKDVSELEDLVSELLSYSKFERSTGQMEISQQPLLLWLKEYMSVADELFDVSIHFSWEQIKESTLVPFNAHHLERAIHNLLQNGSRFAKSQINVRLTCENKFALISIVDDGPGIVKEDREHVFEPFVRLDSSRNRASGGYGLGLSIVKEIARCHGGSVHALEAKLGGAEFLIKLPLK